ncbi:MAG: colanic acid biosynthesis glycosyltransferase WcaL [Verrucomicrobia bacterium]|nr:MAG: colanic acid biosynthesis glycosyltransferase WcaL [Verrucomicrobiota bacterium]
MQPQPKRERTIGYVVNTWPRLSQTFVLNEILGLEERGLDLRIFSAKDPTEQLVNAKVADVRAPVFYLAFHGRYSKIFFGNLRIASRQPGRYLKTLAHALGYGRRDILRRFFQAGYLAEQLRRDSVAHLHAHFATAPATVAMFTHELTGVPFTFTAHARDIYSDTQPELLRAEMKRARSVVTVTEYNRRHLRQIDPSLNGKVRCIDSIFDFSGFDFQWPRVSGLAAPLILSVARLVEKKGLEDLILAADILRWQGQRFRMQIIGDGHLRQVLDNKIAALGLEEHVTLSGAQTHEEVKLAYGRAHVFALPCVVAADGDRDGLPNVLIEAMASGVPVVSTTVVGIPELIESERHGLLVPPGEPRALANALERLLADASLRDRLARAARARIEERFSSERIAERLMNLFFPSEEGKQCRHS